MNTVSLENLEKELKNINIHPSHQRLKILEYLNKNQIHPTVDQIFTDLHKDIPTLSKTTVYNTLKLFFQAGLVKVITIEDNETRYDINIKSHGHFKCESCGTIYDFDIDIDSIASKELKSFKINEKNVYFKGICPRCHLEYK